MTDADRELLERINGPLQQRPHQPLGEGAVTWAQTPVVMNWTVNNFSLVNTHNPLTHPIIPPQQERAFMPLQPLPQPHTWLKPLPPETLQELSHPDDPTYEAAINREVDPLKLAPHTAQTGELLHLNGSAFVVGSVFRAVNGTLRRVTQVDTHMLRGSARGEPHLASAPFFGFPSEGNDTTNTGSQYPQSRYEDDPNRPLYLTRVVNATKIMEITFTRDEIDNAETLFRKHFDSAISNALIDTLSIVSTKGMEDGTTQTKTFFCTANHAFYHRLGATNAQYTAFKLVRPYRIGNTLYTHMLHRGMEFRFAEFTGVLGDLRCGTVSRQMWPIQEMTITGRFAFVAPMPPETYLQGYEGAPLVCQNCGAHHLSEVAFRNVNMSTSSGTFNHRICMSCPISACTVAGCGTVFDPREMIRRMQRNGDSPQRIEIVRTVCTRCVQRNYTSCQTCNGLFPRNEVGSGGYCVECRRNSQECETCGNRFRPLQPDQVECRTCVNRTIRDYSYKPTPKFRMFSNGGETPSITNRYYGIELEVENPGASAEELQEFAGTIARKMSDGLIYIKRDGSIRNGFEIVTHPFTERWYNAEGRDMWDKLLHYLRRNGFEAETTSTCGMHVHVTRASMNSDTLYRAQRFVGCNQKLIAALSRRSIDNLNEWAAPSNNADVSYARELAMGRMTNSSQRRTALNFTEHTVEARFPRSNITREGFNANLEAVVSVFDWGQNAGGDMTAAMGVKYLEHARAGGERYKDLTGHLFPLVGVDRVVAGQAPLPGTIPPRSPNFLEEESDEDDSEPEQDEETWSDRPSRPEERSDCPVRGYESLIQWRRRNGLSSDCWPSNRNNE